MIPDKIYLNLSEEIIADNGSGMPVLKIPKHVIIQENYKPTKNDIQYIRVDKVKELIKAKNDLLACYRLGRRPSEELFNRLEKNEEFLND